MSTIQIRTATISDLKNIQALFVDTIQNTCQNDYSRAEIQAWTASVKNADRWKTALKEQYFILAEIESNLVGIGSLKSGHYIDFMYTSHHYQGQGIASLLLTQLLSEAKRNHSEIVSSDVSITAKPFFLSQGFKVIRKNENKVRGQVLINFHVELHLTSTS